MDFSGVKSAIFGHFLQKILVNDLKTHFLELVHQNYDQKHWIGSGPFLNLGTPERHGILKILSTVVINWRVTMNVGIIDLNFQKCYRF